MGEREFLYYFLIKTFHMFLFPWAMPMAAYLILQAFGLQPTAESAVGD